MTSSRKDSPTVFYIFHKQQTLNKDHTKTKQKLIYRYLFGKIVANILIFILSLQEQYIDKIMARITNELKYLKGTIGNIVFCQRKGITYVRTKPTKYRDAKTDKQLVARGRFRGCNRFYKYELEADMLKLVWKSLAEKTGKNPSNIFMQHNYYAFGMDSEVTNYERLQFSAGLLPMPDQLQIGHYNKRNCTLQWKFDPEENTGLTDDRLYIVELSEPKRPKIHDLDIYRSEGKASFSTLEDINKNMHLYCFWGNKAFTSFSATYYFNEIPLIEP